MPTDSCAHYEMCAGHEMSNTKQVATGTNIFTTFQVCPGLDVTVAGRTVSPVGHVVR